MSVVLAGRSYEVVDLSSDVARHAAGPFATRLEVLEPEAGAIFFCEKVLPHLVPEAVGYLRPEHFPQGAFLRHEFVTASVHAGSHVDAPGHYGPSDQPGPRAINDAALSTFIGPGLVIDAQGPEDDPVGPEAVEQALERLDAEELSGWIALFRTGSERAIGVPAIELLLDRGIVVLGTEAASFDGPFGPMIRRFLERGDSDCLWPAHMLGRRRPYFQLERLAGLEALPRSGFLVFALPVRVEGATAAWSRVCALIPQPS